MTMWTSLHVTLLLALVCATVQAQDNVDQRRRSPSSEAADLERSNNRTVDSSSRDRRNDRSDFQHKYTRLSREASSLKIHLVEVVKTHSRKRSVSLSATLFNHTICFAFAPNYSDPNARILIRRVLKYVSDRICLTFVELTANITSDPNWAINNGCPSNAYILFNTQSTCNSPIGAQSGNQALSVSPCTDPYLGLHEVFHALSVIHSNQDKQTAQAVSLLNDNLQAGMTYTWVAIASSWNLGLNTYSTEMYTPRSWAISGDPVFYCMQWDECVAAYSTSGEDSIFAELNVRYQCNAFACGNSSIDCYPGYYARVKGTCQCVCPDRLDSATNCKKFVNGPSSLTTWPAQATVAAGGADFSCPAGMASPGWVSISGADLGTDTSPVPFPSVGAKTRSMPLCSVTSAASSDPYNWPFGGNYCFVQSSSYPCGGVFQNYRFEFTNSLAVQQNGTIGNITISGNRTVMNLCCKTEVTSWIIDLPNGKPFRLWTTFDCPNVRGLRGFNYRPRYTVTNALAVGDGSPRANNYIYKNPDNFYWDMCYFVPPTYDCSVNGSFGIAQRILTYSSPGFPSSRLPSKRCFICSSIPINGFIKATFNTYDLAADDYLMPNRFSDWLDNSRFDNTLPPVNFISVGGFMCLEYWSSYTSVPNVGVNLTMETVLAAELCYNSTTRGADYIGDQNITEQFEPCLNWKDTRDCYESPNTPMDEMLGYYDGNKCRNPGGNLRRPWCFIWKNGTSCIKRYCDVCGLQQTIDSVPTSVCLANINSTPNFCSSAIQRFGCAKTCNLIPTKSTGCPTNYIPFGRRCLFLSSNLYNRTGAEALCASQGPAGTLLQVRSADDSFLLRQIRYAASGDTSTWINGNVDSTGTVWLHTQTNIPLMYTNWSAAIQPYGNGGVCAALYKDKDLTANQGSFVTYTCSDSTALLTVACQVDRDSACGQPTPPFDGVISDPPKPSYYNGDRVAVVCKYSNDTKVNYMMCKGGSWTNLNYACSPCPNGWQIYGDVCAQYSTTTATAPNAESSCNAAGIGRNGTLFRVKTLSDYVYVLSLRDSFGKGGTSFTYISGKCLGNSAVVYTNSNIPVTYMNMTASKLAGCSNGQWMFVYRNSSTSGSQNGQNCANGTLAYNYVCQMDQLQTPPGDRYNSCQDALGRNAPLCSIAQVTDMCPQSCGISGNATNCTTPTSSTYLRTSPSATISNGQYMTFTCADGCFQTGGDLVRACGLSGTLLGQEPVCDPKPATINMGWNLMNPRIDDAFSQTVFLLNRPEFVVPIAGNISHWYCYTKSNVPFTFVVYRNVSSSYSMVGYNQVSCPSYTAWSVYVQPSSQISVLKGDIVGAYATVGNTLQITKCDYFPNKDWQMPTASVINVTGLGTANFNSTKCIIPSMGYKVTT